MKEWKKENEGHLKKLKQQYNEAGWWKRKRLLKQIAALDVLLEQEARLHLERNDEKWVRMWERGQKLLCNDKFTLVATKGEGSPFSSYARKMTGRIHPNGYLYFETTKTNFVFHYSMSLPHPKSYKGSISALGESDVRAVKVGYDPSAGVLPVRYEGCIDEVGNVQFVPVKFDADSSGHYYVRRIIADPFARVEARRQLFIKGMQEMQRLIKLYRSSVL